MAPEGTEYRLAAIISGDIVGYSRLIGSDETAAVRLVTAYREEIERLVPIHHGQLVDFTGDNFLAHFSSSVAAVECAMDIQQILKTRNQALPEGQRMQFRLGIHQGDVRMEGGRVFGTGVNVAARLEALADPGGICISGSVNDQLQGRLSLRTESMGNRSVKNISEPVPVHRLLLEDASQSSATIPRDLIGSRRNLLVMAGIVAILVMLGAFFWRTVEDGQLAQLTPALVESSAMRTAESGSEVESGTSSHVPSLHEKPSIVVLPFLNMSGDPEQEFFAEGISEDLTTDLSKVPELFVISRSSAFTYKGKEIDAKVVGRELGVRYLLEGSVRKLAGRVRITAQLIDAVTGFHVWSERYDRELSDLFAIQNEIDAKILSALKISIAEAEMARIRRQPIESLSAYEAWHKGRTLIRNFTREDILEGRRLLERAIELQPNYGEAYAELSNSYMAELHSWNFDLALIDKAAEFAEQGLDLSPLSPISLTSLAIIEVTRYRLVEAIRLANRAVELAPSDFTGYSVLGGAYAMMGQDEDAIENFEQAARLNPVAPDVAYTGLATALYFTTGRRDEAIELWERVRATNPEALTDRVSLIYHYHRVGKDIRARLIAQEILQAHPDYEAEQAVEMFRLGGRMSEEELEKLARSLELAGLP
jgi:adenylate cyclase